MGGMGIRSDVIVCLSFTVIWYFSEKCFHASFIISLGRVYNQYCFPK